MDDDADTNLSANIHSSNTSTATYKALRVTMDGYELDFGLATFAENDCGMGKDFYVPVKLVSDMTIVGTDAVPTLTITGTNVSFDLSRIAF